MIGVLEADEKALDGGDVLDEVLLLLFQLIYQRLVLFDVAGLVETELGYVFDAHFIDRAQFDCGLQRMHHITSKDRTAMRADLE